MVGEVALLLGAKVSSTVRSILRDVMHRAVFGISKFGLGLLNCCYSLIFEFMLSIEFGSGEGDAGGTSSVSCIKCKTR